MIILYRIFISLYGAGIRLAAFCGHRKASQWIRGRKGWESRLDVLRDDPRVWFHCASLGEFEQGRPVIEAWKKRNPGHQVILTFFSPSGYEIRKNYEGADVVLYLPEDHPRNAKKFVEMVRPSVVFFVKYEFWHFYLAELKRRQVPLYSISAIFRPDQPFFRSYGKFFRKMLHCFTRFFVQDQASAGLLESIGISAVTVSGDTRFDRVIRVAATAVTHPKLRDFGDSAHVLVAGSTWPEDETLLQALMKENSSLRLLVAPHEVSEERISEVMKKFPSAARLSGSVPPEARVVVIDSIGQLSSLYRFGGVAWVGGGFGKGVHNILEAAVYGRPILFGPNYRKFNEALALVQKQGAFCVKDEKETLSRFRDLQDPSFYRKSSEACSSFVKDSAGATERILEVILPAGRIET